MKHTLRLFALISLCLALAGCKSSRSGKTLLPNVSGKAGEVVVVIDKDNWEGAVGNAMRELLACDCPYLAQREPLFTLANVPPGNFTNMFKVHRNILILNIDPQGTKEGMVYQSDKWAHPQSVAQVNAFTPEGAVAVLSANGAMLAEYFEQAERNRVIANAIKYEEQSLRSPVETLTGGTMHIPSGYRLRKATSDFVWIADDKQYTNQNLLLYRYPAEGIEDPFSLRNIISKRNEIMKENVPGMFDNTWMTTSEAVPPTTVSKRYHGIDFMETRGFWEVYNDYMGGPFVSHSFYGKDGKDILVLEAFVYGPRFDKRQLLREVESILFSFEWKK